MSDRQVEAYVVQENLAASQKQGSKARDRDSNPSQSEERQFAKHQRQKWEIAELLSDERRTAGFDFVDGTVIVWSNHNRMSLILMVCENSNYNATKLTAYASNYKAKRDGSSTCLTSQNLSFSSF